LTGIKDVFGTQISEYVFGYLLAHELKLMQRAREQAKHNWFETGTGTLKGKRLGVMGTGSIARHLAATAITFGLRVTGLSRSGTGVPGFEKVLQVAQLDEFLAPLDYLVSTLPQTNETDDLLNVKSLAKLPRHVYFINVGRSNVVNDHALLDALNNGAMAGAVLDVFDEEPIPRDSPLWDNPNLLITAHIASVSNPSLIVPIFLENYQRFISQKPLKYIVDFDAGY
jgi:phosphoglycerate dehydrogenase-like enzyme